MAALQPPPRSMARTPTQTLVIPNPLAPPECKVEAPEIKRGSPGLQSGVSVAKRGTCFCGSHFPFILLALSSSEGSLEGPFPPKHSTVFALPTRPGVKSAQKPRTSVRGVFLYRFCSSVQVAFDPQCR